MNKILEATTNNGTKVLLPTTLLKDYADEARIAADGNMKKAMRNFSKMIANLMYVRGYKKLVEIRYSCEMQKRVTIIEAV